MGTLPEKSVCSFMGIVSCCVCCTINEVVNKDVLLPCVVGEKGVTHRSDVTVNWQGSKTREIMHSFYEGKDHLEHQGERFRGRTQLFPQEFSQGNASLLLKRLTLNDTGNYSCYAFLNDDTLPSEQRVQLLVSEEEIQIEHRRNRFSLIAVPLLVLGLLCLLACRKQHRSQTSEEALENSRKESCRTTKPWSLKKTTLNETDLREDTGLEELSSVINREKKVRVGSNDVEKAEIQNTTNRLKDMMKNTGEQIPVSCAEDRVQN